MQSHKLERFMSRINDRISISPRLIIILLAYMAVCIFMVYALLFSPWIVIGLSLLAGLAVDKRAWIKRRFRALKESHQDIGN